MDKIIDKWFDTGVKKRGTHGREAHLYWMYWMVGSREKKMDKRKYWIDELKERINGYRNGLDGKPIFDGYIDKQLYKEACGRKCAWSKRIMH